MPGSEDRTPPRRTDEKANPDVCTCTAWVTSDDDISYDIVADDLAQVPDSRRLLRGCGRSPDADRNRPPRHRGPGPRAGSPELRGARLHRRPRRQASDRNGE